MKSQSELNARVELIKEVKTWVDMLPTNREFQGMKLSEMKDVVAKCSWFVSKARSFSAFYAECAAFIESLEIVELFDDDNGDMPCRVSGQVGRYFLRSAIASQDVADSIFMNAQRDYLVYGNKGVTTGFIFVAASNSIQAKTDEIFNSVLPNPPISPFEVRYFDDNGALIVDFFGNEDCQYSAAQNIVDVWFDNNVPTPLYFDNSGEFLPKSNDEKTYYRVTQEETDIIFNQAISELKDIVLVFVDKRVQFLNRKDDQQRTALNFISHRQSAVDNMFAEMVEKYKGYTMIAAYSDCELGMTFTYGAIANVLNACQNHVDYMFDEAIANVRKNLH